MVQTYKPPDFSGQAVQPTITKEDRRIAKHAKDFYHGLLTYDALGDLGYPRRQAKKLRDDWIRRGLAKRAPDRNNSIEVVYHAFNCENVQARQSVQSVQTAMQSGKEKKKNDI